MQFYYDDTDLFGERASAELTEFTYDESFQRIMSDNNSILDNALLSDC